MADTEAPVTPEDTTATPAPTPNDVAAATSPAPSTGDTAETGTDGAAPEVTATDDKSPADAGDQAAPEESDKGSAAPAEPDDSTSDGLDEDDLDDSRIPLKVRKHLREKNRDNERLRARAQAAERQLLAQNVADAAGLPLSFASRLQGTTEEELTEDAMVLLEQIGRKGRVSPSDIPDDGRRRADTGDAVSYDQIASSLYAH